MGGADRIIAGFLQKRDLPEFGIAIGFGAQRAIIMMDAGALQEQSLAIDRKALLAPFELADSAFEGLFISLEGNLDLIEVGIFGRPKMGGVDA